jgi:hypothetical protein
VQNQVDVQTVPAAGRRGRWGGAYTDVYEYDEGTLILDIVSTGTQELLWRGTAKAVMDWKDDPDTTAAKINEAVSKNLERFPP